ncbi:MAG TPA: response regulator transcription factor [Candidatus Dormibacteraeota bacterium]|nr:response regulator transcription factor [Candidatus Dormibacteraeota bacterium]
MPKSILIVDDNPSVRRVIRRILESHHDFDICGEAVNGQDAIAKARQLRPDLIVLDFSMPVMNGVEAADMLSKTMPEIPLIMLTAHKNRFIELIARAAGVRTVLLKDERMEGSLRDAVHELTPN